MRILTLSGVILKLPLKAHLSSLSSKFNIQGGHSDDHGLHDHDKLVFENNGYTYLGGENDVVWTTKMARLIFLYCVVFRYFKNLLEILNILPDKEFPTVHIFFPEIKDNYIHLIKWNRTSQNCPRVMVLQNNAKFDRSWSCVALGPSLKTLALENIKKGLEFEVINFVPANYEILVRQRHFYVPVAHHVSAVQVLCVDVFSSRLIDIMESDVKLIYLGSANYGGYIQEIEISPLAFRVLNCLVTAFIFKQVNKLSSLKLLVTFSYVCGGFVLLESLVLFDPPQSLIGNVRNKIQVGMTHELFYHYCGWVTLVFEPYVEPFLLIHYVLVLHFGERTTSSNIHVVPVFHFVLDVATLLIGCFVHKGSSKFNQWDTGGCSVRRESLFEWETTWTHVTWKIATTPQHYIGFNLEDKVDFKGDGNVICDGICDETFYLSLILFSLIILLFPL